MKLLNIFKAFAKEESGAVTVDFVVLTAAIVGLGIIVISTLQPAIEDTANAIAEDMDNATQIGR
jgi:Flp pilus assembly pilin Flp